MSGLYIKLIAAIAPAIILAVMMVRRDKARPEPKRWLLGAAGLGIAAGVAVIVLGMTVLPSVEIDSFLAAFYNAFVCAALPEEGMKLIVTHIL